MAVTCKIGRMIDLEYFPVGTVFVDDCCGDEWRVAQVRISQLGDVRNYLVSFVGREYTNRLVYPHEIRPGCFSVKR